ncbi:DUF1990 domain-containing protein [Sphaerisporangium flaviroseum]|uniref:DUF1990 domain-containing protein n=1 Tax=Sphaerisporangium flaviroseum TaxID=509199 RepID=A0ABP7IDF8_9ACTN
MDLKRYDDAEPTYAEVGATRTEELPEGYRRITRRYEMGDGARLGRAADALLTWRMHAALGLSPQATAPRAAPGVVVASRLGLGPFALVAPCRVVWTVEEDRRAGFAYGTLPGHPESGEESFLLEVADDGSLSFTVRSFTRPGRWYTRAAWPLVAMVQRFFVNRYAAALRRHIR